MLEQPFTLRDFSSGRYAKSAVADSLVPQNSASNSLNVLFDQTIGKAIVRKGTTMIGKPLVGTFVLEDSFYNASDSSVQTYGTNYNAQTFLANGNYDIAGVVLKLSRTGTITNGVVQVLIVGTSGAAPAIGALKAQSFEADANSITTNAAGADYFFPLSDFAIVSGTTYAIVLRVITGDGSHYISWLDVSTGGYAGGTAYESTNSGVSWSSETLSFLFKLYGKTAGTSGNKTPLGLTQFKTTSGSGFNDILVIEDINAGIAGFTLPAAAGSGVMFYWNGIWNAGYMGINQTVKTRFAVLGSEFFFTNSIDGMLASTDPSSPPTTTNCITTNSVKPSLVFRAQNRLLASGYATFSSRVYFSSIINQNNNPFITWSTDPGVGDWIDINPNDGGDVVGFTGVPNATLVFKNNGFYRLDAIATTATPDPVSPIGAVSQEAITVCQSIAYYFSGTGIWSTQGDIPQLISRLGIQDFIDAIPQANWVNVTLGADDFNVYASIGNVTINQNQDNQMTYNNVVLKFSVRDQSWSIHSYGNSFSFFTPYTSTSGKILVEADTTGLVQQVNSGTTDNGTPISYSLETQELEFGDRSHKKVISSKLVIFNKYSQSSQVQIKADDGNFKDIEINTDKRVAINDDINEAGHFFTLRWFGESTGKSPEFEGFSFPKINDEGVVND